MTILPRQIRVTLWGCVMGLLLGTVLMLSETQAQEQNPPPLYNRSGQTGTQDSGSGAGVTGAGKPLFLPRLLQGSSKNNAGTPGGTGSSANKPMYSSDFMAPSSADIDAYRQKQAEDYQRTQQEAQASLLAYNNPSQEEISQQTRQYLNQFQNSGTPGGFVMGGTGARQIYNGRNTGVTSPPKTFKSVE
ncbi:MAG: hypothetical protein J0L77_03060 [Alphaproteobacteria bacterium]|nr:hypothetical protein [Alphaproteobacteria bacterium]